MINVDPDGNAEENATGGVPPTNPTQNIGGNPKAVLNTVNKVNNGKSSVPATKAPKSSSKNQSQTKNDTTDNNGVNGPFDPVKAIVKAKFGKGDFGIGQASPSEAEALGVAWVGPGARMMKNGKGFVSEDGLRAYRMPEKKNAPAELNPTGWQANYTQKDPTTGKEIGNAHLNIDINSSH